MTVRLLLFIVSLLAAMPSAASAQAQFPDKFFDSNGVQIRYVEAGTGEPMVLLDGAGGSLDTFVTAGVVSDLSRNYRVMAFDARGHGKRGKPHDAKMYGHEMALDAVRLGVGRAPGTRSNRAGEGMHQSVLDSAPFPAEYADAD